MSNILINLLFPRFCFHCKAVGRFLCTSCARQMRFISKQTCPYCEKDSLYGTTHGVCSQLNGVDGLFSIYEYSPIFRSAITAIKFRRIRQGIATLMQNIPHSTWEQLVFINTIYYKNALLVPIPLHITRKRERGFNQAEDCARAFSIMLQRPEEHVLVRDRATAPQSRLSSVAARFANINGAFVYSRKISTQSLVNNVVLVDDVWTTGATIKAAAQVLKIAGVERVYALTLAKRLKKIML